MNLNEDHIIDAIESYCSKFEKTNEEMAEICGMAKRLPVAKSSTC
jgi:hypothetical protein